MKSFTKNITLQELLCEVLDVALGDGSLGSDLGQKTKKKEKKKKIFQCLLSAELRKPYSELVLVEVDRDLVSEVANLATDLDVLNKELLKGSAVKDTVGKGSREVDDKAETGCEQEPK